jgi:membrane-bound lytic murein transglycosylase B
MTTTPNLDTPRPGDAAPVSRRWGPCRILVAAIAAVVLVAAAEPAPAADPAFDRWVREFWPQAKAAGITRATFDAAFAGVHARDPEVLELAERQPEFTQTLAAYMARAVSDTRVENGRKMLAEYGPWLKRIEAGLGVQPEIVVAIWGMESSYGAVLDNPKVVRSVVRSLATLGCCDPKRSRFGRKQLIAALKIIQRGDVSPPRMTGSWAGAMGHTQFIPTSYLAYSMDANGDGRVDIWGTIPDALATTANLLAENGWQRGETWGYEVALPKAFNYGLVGGKARSLADWQKLGVRRATGGGFPRPEDAARLIMPAGSQGPAFLVLKNFSVIKRYNNADSYALAVGHLADRILGGGPLTVAWPAEVRPLSSAEIAEMQRLLSARGFSTGGVDGKVGPGTMKAIRAFQAREGLVADGYPSADVLDRLKEG